jgi:hypothetical protein
MPNPDEQGVLSQKEITEAQTALDSKLEMDLDTSRKKQKVTIQQFMEDQWSDIKYATEKDFEKPMETGVPLQTLQEIAKKLTAFLTIWYSLKKPSNWWRSAPR